MTGGKTAGSDAEGGARDGERLQKVLARAGVASRRHAEVWIRAGRVLVNGNVARLGDRVLPGDRVSVDGRPLERRTRHTTYLLNKPVGVLSTARDERGRPTVMGLVPDEPGLHPVGRLDLDSEGLLLLTTDGELTLLASHPRYGIDKEYRAWCAEGAVAAAALARLRRGVELEDGPARALEARAAPGGCSLVLTEGRNREVRRMLAAVGYTVTRLVRVRLGPLRLGELPSGAFRPVRDDELERLRARAARRE